MKKAVLNITGFLLAAALCAPAQAGAPCGTKQIDESKFNPPDCNSPNYKDKKEQCQKCVSAMSKAKKSTKSYASHKTACEAEKASCGDKIKGDFTPPTETAPMTGITMNFVTPFRWIGHLVPGACETAYAGTQRGGMTNDASLSGVAKGCYTKMGSEMTGAGGDAQKCQADLEKACKGISEGEAAGQECKDAKDDAKKAAGENGDKAQKAGDNQDKSGDNAKKEGGMPQMPQIPQMPQQQSQDQPQTTTDSSTTSTPTSSAVATETAPGIETSKIGDPTKVDNGSVNFGTAPASPTSTIAPPSSPAFAGGSSPAFGSGGTGFHSGSDGVGNGVGAAVGSVGSGSGGGGGFNSSGASSPLAGGKGEGAGAAGDGKGGAGSGGEGNELNMAGGGKLGAPKGFKGGGEPDAVIADNAKDAFKSDFNVDKNRDPAADGKGSDENEDGQSVFKMVKYRYAELKKKGAI